MSETRTCPTCLAQVSVNERFCANCGNRLPDISQPSIAPTQILPPSGPSNQGFNVPPSGPNNQGQFNVPNSTPPQPKRGFPVWAIVLLVLVGLCAIVGVGGIGLLAYLGNEVANTVTTPRPTGQGGGIVPMATSENDDPTDEPADDPTAETEPSGDDPQPTFESIPTVGPEATSSGNGGGIVGGIGGGNNGGSTDDPNALMTEVAQTADALIATILPEGTALPEATTVPAVDVAQLFSVSREVFRDEFVDNRNNWFTGVFEEIETDVIEDGVFKVIWTGRGTSYEIYEVRPLTNFISDVDCHIVQGDLDGSCSLIFGQQEDVGFYKFEVFHDYYRLTVFYPEGDPVVLVEGDPAGIVIPLEVNKLRVIKQGTTIHLFLNDVLLNTLEDTTYPSGMIGVSTNSYNEEGGVEVWFDNFIIWELP